MGIFRHLKDVARLEEILQVFVREGLGHYLIQTKLKAKMHHTPIPPPKNLQLAALHFRHALEQLGPAFIKLGQLLSLRPDLVPEEFCKELEKLQDTVPPIPFPEIKKKIEAELGKPLSSLFRSVEKKPLASASVAQVHAAVLKSGKNLTSGKYLKSGKKVVIKVQRPDAAKQLRADIDIMFHLARLLERRSSSWRTYRPSKVVEEFSRWTEKELNFEHEAHSLLRLRSALKDNPGIHIPDVHLQLTSSGILTLERLDGIKITKAMGTKRAIGTKGTKTAGIKGKKRFGFSRRDLASTFFTSILEQALLHGIFHADPHPANIFVEKNGKIAFLDFGIVGELSPADRQKFISFILAVESKNPQKCLDVILSLAEDTDSADVSGFREEAFEILESVAITSVQKRSAGMALYQIISKGAQYGITFNPNHVLFAKSIYQAEGLAMQLDPQFRVMDSLISFAKDYLEKRYSPKEVSRRFFNTFWENREVIANFPQKLLSVLDKIEQLPAFEKKEVRGIETESAAVVRRHERFIVMIALFMGAALLLYLEGKTSLWGIPLSIIVLGIAVLLFASSIFIHPKVQPT